LSKMIQGSDEKLMLNYQQGSHAAFERLYQQHKGPVYRYILRQGIAQDQADELFQDIWSAIIKSRLTYQVKAKFTTWLYQIARNKIVDHYRQHKQHLQLEDEHLENTPDDEIEGSEDQRNQLLGEVANLPFPQRQSFLLYYESGLTMEAIAEITESNKEAVKSRIRYAVNKLKAVLGVHNES